MRSYFTRGKKQFTGEEETKDCCICMAEFEGQDELVELKCNANHVFHLDCMLGWFQRLKGESKDMTCPLCRALVSVPKKGEVQPEAAQNESEQEPAADLEAA